MKTIVTLALFILTASATPQALPSAPQSAASPRILVQNRYYPKSGQLASVLATRLEASAVRKKLGLSMGTVLLRQGDAGEGPAVIWECEYATIEDRRADAARAEAAPEFAVVQRKMRNLILRFERANWELRGS